MNVKVFGLPTGRLKNCPIKVPEVFMKSELETNCKPTGKISNTSTFVAVLGPAFVTTIV